MAFTKTILDQFIAYGDGVFFALNGYDVHEDKMGRACARGTLTARLNSLRVMSAALETREPNDKDKAELVALVSTLNWLKTDTYVTKDLDGLEITIGETPFATDHPSAAVVGDTDFASAISGLIRGVTDVVLSQNC